MFNFKIQKVTLLIGVFLLICGTVWGQQLFDIRNDKGPFDVFEFDAVKTVSTASRYSVGLFGGIEDDYIHPTFFDQSIGTFFMFGGFPQSANVTGTEILTTGNNEISVGYGQTLGKGYLGVYYLGSIGNGSSTREDGNPYGTQTDNFQSYNNIAVLYGTSSFGIRVDVKLPDSVFETAYGEKWKMIESEVEHIENASIAVTFGSTLGGGEDKAGIPLWATLGVILPNSELVTDDPLGGNPKNSYTVLTGAALGLTGGAILPLKEDSLVVTAALGVLLPDSEVGAYKKVTGNDPYIEDGGFGLGATAQFQKEVKFGEYATVIIAPGAQLQFTAQNPEFSTEKGNNKSNRLDADLRITPGFDIGLKYEFEKIAFYTGLGLKLFDFDVWGRSQTKAQDGSKVTHGSAAYTNFEGIEWKGETLSGAGDLGFGVEFTPIENLRFGAGLTTLLFNPKAMTLSNTGNATTARNLTHFTASLTVSYSFK